MVESEKNLGIIGSSAYANDLRDNIRNVAQGDFPVMVLGPSGTGKELVSCAIHDCSPRKDNKLAVVNCAAIPRNLEENEFFGHIKGSFTGALDNKLGLLSSSHNSTLFLDEVGDISLEMQAKLLRFLDSGEYMPIGSSTLKRSDTRVVCATNKNLEQMVQEGGFREDLYYRLKGVVINTLALSEHPEDIPELVRFFIRRVKRNDTPKKIDDEAMGILTSYSWPGNIRELKYAIDVICMTNIGADIIKRNMLYPTIKIRRKTDVNVNAPVKPYMTHKSEVVKDFDRYYFAKLLVQFGGNVSKSAQAAGMYRANLTKKLNELGISAKDFKST